MTIKETQELLELELRLRAETIVTRRNNGETFSSIGKDYGLTRQRVCQIYRLYKIEQRIRAQAFPTLAEVEKENEKR